LFSRIGSLVTTFPDCVVVKLTGLGEAAKRTLNFQAISSPSHGSLSLYFPLNQFCYVQVELLSNAETHYAEISVAYLCVYDQLLKIINNCQTSK
jgi:hypothetical protein